MPKNIFCSAAIAMACLLSLPCTGGAWAANDGDAPATQPDDAPQMRSTDEVKMQGLELPASWKTEPIKTAGTHTDAEWQSATGQTVVGAVYIHVPPLMGGKALAKSVKDHYAQQQPDGKITRQWTDSDRNWFEVDANGTHTKAFIITEGHHAWFVYYRYATGGGSAGDEIAAADHAINDIEPMPQ